LQESGASDSKHAKEAETARKVVSTLKDKLAAAEAELSDLQQRYDKLLRAHSEYETVLSSARSNAATLEARLAEVQTEAETKVCSILLGHPCMVPCPICIEFLGKRLHKRVEEASWSIGHVRGLDNVM
jgi:DNA repair exonuclease SbcCD ATPase subunit